MIILVSHLLTFVTLASVNDTKVQYQRDLVEGHPCRNHVLTLGPRSNIQQSTPYLPYCKSSSPSLPWVLSVVNVWIMFYGSHVLLRYSIFATVSPRSVQGILPRTRTALLVLFHSSNCLIAYTVLAQL